MKFFQLDPTLVQTYFNRFFWGQVLDGSAVNEKKMIDMLFCWDTSPDCDNLNL